MTGDQPTAKQLPAVVDDMKALIIRLAHALKKASPGNELCGQALDYLARHGLGASPLRAETNLTEGLHK